MPDRTSCPGPCPARNGGIATDIGIRQEAENLTGVIGFELGDQHPHVRPNTVVATAGRQPVRDPAGCYVLEWPDQRAHGASTIKANPGCAPATRSRSGTDRLALLSASHSRMLCRMVRPTNRADGTMYRLSSRLNRRKNHSARTGSVSAAPRNWSNRLPTGRYHDSIGPVARCRTRSPIAFIVHTG